MPMPYRTDDASAARRAFVRVAASLPVPAPGDVVSTGAPIVYVESPARLLLEQLSGRLDPVAVADDGRWPGAARLAFIVGATSALWALIGAAALRL